MVSTQTLMELVRGSVLDPDEPITWVKEFPDGPAVGVQTPERVLFAQVDTGWRVLDTPGVAAVVVVRREDRDTGGPSARRWFLLFDDDPFAERAVDLDDPRAVARFGRSLRDGALDPVAYAEILAERHWPGAGPRQVVTDPAAWLATLPADRPGPPPVRPPRTWDDEYGDRWLAFHAARQDPDADGPDVVLWTVRVPPAGPATWLRRPAER